MLKVHVHRERNALVSVNPLLTQLEVDVILTLKAAFDWHALDKCDSGVLVNAIVK